MPRNTMISVSFAALALHLIAKSTLALIGAFRFNTCLGLAKAHAAV
ncbi:hypothetical protein AB0M29_03380 [Streptomyces sp. NPDC051976]